MFSLTFKRLVRGIYRDASTNAEILAKGGVWHVYLLRPNSSEHTLVAICSTLRDAKTAAAVILTAHVRRAHVEALEAEQADAHR